MSVFRGLCSEMETLSQQYKELRQLIWRRGENEDSGGDGKSRGVCFGMGLCGTGNATVDSHLTGFSLNWSNSILNIQIDSHLTGQVAAKRPKFLNSHLTGQIWPRSGQIC